MRSEISPLSGFRKWTEQFDNVQHKRYVVPDAQGYLRSGFYAHSEGNLDEAIDYYTKVISLEPAPFIALVAYYHRGIAYGKKGDFDKAIIDFSTAISLNSDYTIAYNNRGNAYQAKGEVGRAIQDYNTTIALSPGFAAAYYNRGLAWLRLQQWEKAKANLITSKNMGSAIVAAFHITYKSVEDFEAQHDVRVPEDIAALLSGE